MIFFGTGAGTVGSGQLAGVTCVHCATPDSVHAVVFSRYFHLYWIPMFPIGKTGMTTCLHCKQGLEAQETPAVYHAPYLAVKNRTRFPLKHYAGLIIVGIFALYIIIANLLG